MWERSTNAHKIAILDFVKALRSSRAASPDPDPFYWDQDPNLDLIFLTVLNQDMSVYCVIKLVKTVLENGGGK